MEVDGTSNSSPDAVTIMRPLQLALTALFLMALPAALRGQDPVSIGLTARLPVDSAVTVGRLPNGLRYYIRENREPRQRAELRLVVNAGSVLEGDDQRGLAHMLEHMAFNGTRHFQKQELVSYLESIGMRFGADLNATTSFDETTYYLTVPTDTGRALQKGVEILGDWARYQSFDPEEIDKERGVVIEEWRLGQGAAARMRDQYLPVLLRGSRYAARLPIGDTVTLRHFRPAVLERFYHDWYRPDLMAVVAVGDFNAARVEALIKQQFADFRAPGDAPTRPTYSVPTNDEPLVSIATDREATNTTVNVFYKHPVAEQSTAADYRRGLVEQLYNGMLNARFSELAQQPNPPFIGASSSEGSLIRTQAAYVLGALVREGGVPTGLEALLTEAQRVARFGFTASELSREKARLLRSYESAYAERAKTNSASYAAEYARAYLDGEPIPGIGFEYGLAKRFLPDVTLTEVNAVATAWITDRNRVVVVQAPRSDSIPVPTASQLLAVFDSVRHENITPYHDVVAAATLVPHPPAPGSIVQEDSIPEIGVTEWRLDNGVRVLLKPTDFKDDEVQFRSYGPGGVSLAPDSLVLDALLATTAVNASGVGAFSAVQLQKALAGKDVQVQPYIGETQEGLAGVGSPKDLETLFQLIYLYTTGARRDSLALLSFRERMMAALANRGANPRAAFQDTLNLVLTGHSPRAPLLTAESLRAWDTDRSLAFYRDRFADAGETTFAFVGSFQLDDIRPLVVRYLGALPATGRNEQWRDVGLRPPTGVIERSVHQGMEPQSLTQIVFMGPFQYTPENRELLRSLADVLEIRLRDVLREELSGTYGVSVSPSYQRDPWPKYSLSIGFGAAPQRLDELTRVVFQQIDSLQADGPGATVLEKVQETQRRELQESLRRNSFWVTNLLGRDMTGEDPRDIPHQQRRIDALTAEQIRAAARTYLRRDHYVRVSLYPTQGSRP